MHRILIRDSIEISAKNLRVTELLDVIVQLRQVALLQVVLSESVHVTREKSEML